MNDLVLHALTREQLDRLVDAPPHALILAGPAGSGKRTVAIELAELILEQPGGFVDYPYKMLISDETGKSIGIETVRELERFLGLKVPAAKTHNRPVIIESAHLLTLEAQNALLKTLEEPPAGTFLILTTASEQALLPTIRSRARTIDIKRPGKQAIQEFFIKKNVTEKTVTQAYAISGGLAGLMSALLEQADHPLMQATEYARRLLSQPVYERLLSVDELSKQKQLAIDTMFILQQMAHVSLQAAAGPAAAKWQKVMGASYAAQEALINNAQPKLVLTNLMLSF